MGKEGAEDKVVLEADGAPLLARAEAEVEAMAMDLDIEVIAREPCAVEEDGSSR